MFISCAWCVSVCIGRAPSADDACSQVDGINAIFCVVSSRPSGGGRERLMLFHSNTVGRSPVISDDLLVSLPSYILHIVSPHLRPARHRLRLPGVSLSTHRDTHSHRNTWRGGLCVPQIKNDSYSIHAPHFVFCPFIEYLNEQII